MRALTSPDLSMRKRAYDERKVVLALAAAPYAWTYADARGVVSEYGLPDGEEALRRYARHPA